MFESHYFDGVVAMISTSEGINDVILSFVYNGHIAGTSTAGCLVFHKDGVVV